MAYIENLDGETEVVNAEKIAVFMDGTVHKHTSWRDYTPPINRLYKSLGGFLQYCESLPGNPSVTEDRWSGGSWKTVLDLAHNGWPEGLEKARNLAIKIADRIARATEYVEVDTLQYDASGAAFDIGAVLQGVPESWVRIVPVPQKKVITLVTNVCCSAGISTEVMISRGIAVSALVLAFQQRGYPVSVWAGDEMGGGPNGVESTYVQILDPNYPTLDMDRVIFALAHPGFFRQLLFAENDGDRAAHLNRQRGGRVIEGRQPPELKEKSIYMGSAHLSQVQRWTDGGEAWILEQFKAQTTES